MMSNPVRVGTEGEGLDDGLGLDDVVGDALGLGVGDGAGDGEAAGPVTVKLPHGCGSTVAQIL